MEEDQIDVGEPHRPIDPFRRDGRRPDDLIPGERRSIYRYDLTIYEAQILTHIRDQEDDQILLPQRIKIGLTGDEHLAVFILDLHLKPRGEVRGRQIQSEGTPGIRWDMHLGQSRHVLPLDPRPNSPVKRFVARLHQDQRFNPSTPFAQPIDPRLQLKVQLRRGTEDAQKQHPDHPISPMSILSSISISSSAFLWWNHLFVY